MTMWYFEQPAVIPCCVLSGLDGWTGDGDNEEFGEEDEEVGFEVELDFEIELVLFPLPSRTQAAV